MVWISTPVAQNLGSSAPVVVYIDTLHCLCSSWRLQSCQFSTWSSVHGTWTPSSIATSGTLLFSLCNEHHTAFHAAHHHPQPYLAYFAVETWSLWGLGPAGPNGLACIFTRRPPLLPCFCFCSPLCLQHNQGGIVKALSVHWIRWGQVQFYECIKFIVSSDIQEFGPKELD